MRGFRGGMGLMLAAGASMGSMLAGIMSFRHAGLPNFFENPNAPQVKPRPRQTKRRPGAVHRGWKPHYFAVNTSPDSQEAMRRWSQIERGQLRVENGLVPS